LDQRKASVLVASEEAERRAWMKDRSEGVRKVAVEG
jgi:hypothetical protein